jgi:hypothetical protein
MVHAWPTNSSANLKLVLDKSPRWERKLGWEQHVTLGSFIPKWSIIFAWNNLTIGQLKGFVNFKSLKVFAYQNLLLLAFFLLLNQRPNSSFNIERPPTNSKFHLPILILETQTLHDNFQNKELHWSCWELKLSTKTNYKDFLSSFDPPIPAHSK